MAKPKVSSKDLRKTDLRKKGNYYPKEQTCYGKNKIEAPEQRRLLFGSSKRDVKW